MTQASLPQEVPMAFGHRSLSGTDCKYYMDRKPVVMKERFHKTTVHFNNCGKEGGHNRQLKSKHFNPRDDSLKTGLITKKSLEWKLQANREKTKPLKDLQFLWYIRFHKDRQCHTKNSSINAAAGAAAGLQLCNFSDYKKILK